jgi:ATP-dependent DNA helicase RecG
MKTEDSIRSLKGIGEKTERLFNKLGVLTLKQLLHYYPRDYDLYGEPVLLKDMKINQKQSILSVLTKVPEIKRLRNKTLVTVILTDGSSRLVLKWFNMPFLRNTLKRGSRYVFRGMVQEKRGVIQMDQPEIFTDTAYEKTSGRMMPVYALTAGLSNKTISKAVRVLLDDKLLETEYLPEDIRSRFQLSEINYAVCQIHFPDNRKSMEAARKRLVFDEFFFFLMMIAGLKESKESRKSKWMLKEVWKTEEVIENLPYQLTKAQLRVWNEIESDLKGHVRMSRLIQGDVGSGKTILAFLAMIMTASNNFQSALMVPTEVLARQHYESLVSLLESNGLSDYAPVLLTGSNTAKEKRKIYDRIATGDTKMIIGTHALIQERIEYQNLALVITDEQHKTKRVSFGKGSYASCSGYECDAHPQNACHYALWGSGYFRDRRAPRKASANKKLCC